MKAMALSLVNSKKFWVFVLGLVVVLLNRLLDLGLTGEDLAAIGGANIAALLGFGLADHGKEKAKAIMGATSVSSGDSSADPL